MISINNMIDGVILFELRQINDERGAILHMLRSDAPEFTNFGECYFSEILPGAIKAWKRHHVHTQNLAVPIGRVRFVIYDEREDSITRGRVQVIQLGRPDDYLRLQIPPGLWYGFACLGNVPALLVNCSDGVHDPAESQHKDIDVINIPYKWAGIAYE